MNSLNDELPEFSSEVVITDNNSLESMDEIEEEEVKSKELIRSF
jgi:hypothetical protein